LLASVLLFVVACYAAKFSMLAALLQMFSLLQKQVDDGLSPSIDASDFPNNCETPNLKILSPEPEDH